MDNADDIKKMKTLFAIGSSGSVSGNAFYHDNLKSIIDKYYKPGDIFYLCASDFESKTKDEIDKFIAERKGSGGMLQS